MTAVSDDLLHLLTDAHAVTPDDISDLVAEHTPTDHVRVLHDVVQGLRMSAPRVEDVRPLGAEEVTALGPAPQGHDGTIGVVSVVTRFGISGQVFFTTSSDGSLGGLRMQAEEPSIATTSDLRDQLRRLDPRAAVAVHTPEFDAVDTHPKAVSSLVKVFVLEAVLRAVAAGQLGLDDAHRVSAEDLSPLSAGLDGRHVGSSLTTAELCRLMILRSDNTATDMLLGTVGSDAVLDVMARCGADPDLNRPLCSMRETIEAAWLSAPDARTSTHADAAEQATSIALRTPAHHAGYDYFVPLGAVGCALEAVSSRDWSPWGPSGHPVDQVVYKGGSAPGVLSAAWFRGRGRDSSWSTFAINPEDPLGAMEELFAFTCAETLLHELGFPHLDDRAPQPAEVA